ncbi:hypothetical protein C8R43DRAFT_698606 [Mycena crocata]|nr:hypothetical protein C8R43DRAFT_698606 [Mycena crocata]
MPALRTRDTHPAVRSLEVSTTAPPPSLTIISPTPRAFTFPIAHNLSDSPYSSPSNSPFEPDLRALALSASSSSTPSSSVSSHNDECRTPPPLSAFTRTLSPESAAPSSPPPPAPIRRKSTSAAAGGPEERRPKKGDDDYVKRPENAFILFRRKCCEDRALSISSPSTSAPSSLASGPSSADSPSLAGNVPGKKQRQADLSKTISQQWKALSPDERAHWEALAKEKKREHETLHPNYVYRPQRSGAKNRTANASAAAASSSSSTTQRRKHSAPPPQQQQVEFVVPTPRAQHGRSASAPTPPPYQAIQIPNVYMGSSPGSSFSTDGGDSPTSLMPMISRRGVGNGNGGFDYMPSFASFDFEASLQSSEFLRAMFPPTISPTSPPDILSPASSTSGSGPSSPYTPASAAFHPSAFSNSYNTTLSPAAALEAAYNNATDMGLGLDAPIALNGEPGVAGTVDADYSSYAASWAAASPWATSNTGAGLAEGDFDIGRIPEIGWDMGCAAFPAAQPAFPGSDYSSGEMHDFSDGMGGMGMGGEQQQFGEHNGELDLQFGDLGMTEMGFDEMMAGQSF